MLTCAELVHDVLNLLLGLVLLEGSLSEGDNLGADAALVDSEVQVLSGLLVRVKDVKSLLGGGTDSKELADAVSRELGLEQLDHERDVRRNLVAGGGQLLQGRGLDD